MLATRHETNRRPLHAFCDASSTALRGYSKKFTDTVLRRVQELLKMAFDLHVLLHVSALDPSSPASKADTPS